MPSFYDKAKKVINQHQDLFLVLEDLDKTGKLHKLKYKKRVNFTIDEDLVRQFHNYCIHHHLEMSPVIERLIRGYLQNNKP